MPSNNGLIERLKATLTNAKTTYKNPTNQLTPEYRMGEAIDAITELERQLAASHKEASEIETKLDISREVVRDEASSGDVWKSRALAAEAKLAKAVEALETIALIGEGSRTANSLTNIAGIARSAIEECRRS